MDLTAEFYLQTVDTVFVRHALPNGQMMHRDRLVRTETIRRTALMTVEGERDDISGVGQTKAAHALCTNLPYEKKQHYLALQVGHYGVFNGSRYRKDIQPRIADFIRKHDAAQPVAKAAVKPVNGRRARDLAARMADAMGITALSGNNISQVTGAITGGLTEIVGIGPTTAEKLNKLGVFDVGQLAKMAEDAMHGLDEQMGGRASRENWFGQARKLMGLDAK
jgi:poly(3-hydroxybutyrate) depolymerase